MEFVVMQRGKNASGKMVWFELDAFQTIEEADKYMADLVHIYQYPYYDYKITKRVAA